MYIPCLNNIGKFQPITTTKWSIFTPFKYGGDRQNQIILVRYVIYGFIFSLPLAKALTLLVSQDPGVS